MSKKAAKHNIKTNLSFVEADKEMMLCPPQYTQHAHQENQLITTCSHIF